MGMTFPHRNTPPPLLGLQSASALPRSPAAKQKRKRPLIAPRLFHIRGEGTLRRYVNQPPPLRPPNPPRSAGPLA